MSLRGSPGIVPKDLIYIQPVKFVEASDETETDTYQEVGPRLLTHSEKLTTGRAFNQGKSINSLNYTLYIDYRRGQTYPFGEKDYIWHPEASKLMGDGSLDYQSLLTIISIIPYKQDGVARIDASREV